MKILVTGGNGQLGRALKKCLSGIVNIIALDSDSCDVTDNEHIDDVFRLYSPNFIIHCAAYTAVDQAEKDENMCRKINVCGTQNIADGCHKYNIPLMLLSTDYVFDNNGCIPHLEDDCRRALNVYGQSKIDAEDIVMELSKYYIVRTSWLFGDGNNFVRTIYNLSLTRNIINVVDDQIGSPTYSEDLAFSIIELIEKAPYGIYHITNEGTCSWAQLAQKTIEFTGLDTRINPVSSAEYGSKAKRPLNSRLSKNKLDRYGIARLPNWENALNRYIETWKAAK